MGPDLNPEAGLVSIAKIKAIFLKFFVAFVAFCSHEMAQGAQDVAVQTSRGKGVSDKPFQFR